MLIYVSRTREKARKIPNSTNPNAVRFFGNLLIQCDGNERLSSLWGIGERTQGW